MPKKLNISSNERIDLDDFNRASADYTQESDNFERQKLVQARRSLVDAGFRIEVSNQTSSPGEFTVYNGVALDRSGNFLNNEQQINDARTLTLTGTGTSFYVEIEFVEEESDVNSRAFWDPTFSPANPPGKEFNLNVATRVAPDWQIVSPVSTTGFDVDSNVNSVKIPIAILYTNVSNEIEGFTAVNVASVLEEDILAATTEFRVLDSTLFPSSSATASLGFGTASVEVVNITGNDRANGIITISPGTTNPHSAGAILKETGAPTWLPEDTDAVPVAPAAGDSADQRRGLFAGDELRGSALSASAQDVSARSDLAVQSLKDHIDFLSSQIRELKFGNLRSDVDSGLPPSSFASTRYYDPAGGVAGARTRTVTVGDGVTSFGDLNTTTDDLGTILQEAHDGLDATNGGSVFVKTGDYTWSAAFTTDRPIEVVFDKGALFSSVSNFTITVSTADSFVLRNFPSPPGGSDPVYLSGNSSRDIELENCHLRMNVNLGGRELYARGCTFEGTSVHSACAITSTTAVGTSNYIFDDCSFTIDAATQVGVYLYLAGDLIFRACRFFSERGRVLQLQQCDNIVFEDCTFESGDGAPTNGPQLMTVYSTETSQEKPIVFRNCRAVVGDSSVAGTPVWSILEFGGEKDTEKGIWIEVDGFHIEYAAATMTPEAVLTLRGFGHQGKINVYRNMTVNINGVSAASHAGSGMINIGDLTRVENFQLLEFANPSAAIASAPICNVLGDNIDIHGIKFRHDGVVGTLTFGYNGILRIGGQFVNVHDVHFENTLNHRSSAGANDGTFIQTLGAAFPTYGPIMVDGVFMPVGELWCPTNENLVIIGLHSERSTLKRFSGFLTVSTGSWEGPLIHINSQFCMVDSAVIQQTVQDGIQYFIQIGSSGDFSAVTNCLAEFNDSDSICDFVIIDLGANYCRVNNNTANAQSGTASVDDNGTGTVEIGNSFQ